MYRPAHRRLPRVRAFNEFVATLFREIDGAAGAVQIASPRPAWHRWPHERPPASFRKS
jgi:hypothetical protein